MVYLVRKIEPQAAFRMQANEIQINKFESNLDIQRFWNKNSGSNLKHQLINFLPTNPILYNPLLCTNSVQANYNDFQLPIQRPVEITNHEPPQLFAIRHLLQNQNISSQFRNPQLFQYIHAICHPRYSPL